MDPGERRAHQPTKISDIWALLRATSRLVDRVHLQKKQKKEIGSEMDRLVRDGGSARREEGGHWKGWKG